MRKTLAALALIALAPLATSAYAQNSQAQAEGEPVAPAMSGVDTMSTNSISSDMPKIVPPESDDDGGILVPGSGADFYKSPSQPENDAQEEAITNDQQPNPVDAQ
ncbi:hypothetical protein [Aurantimonas sp. Leaf443]|uniref:hypothetical protein n=1 Tax=Aurantimonas sp. Leaf443 TaxID=1736378 RepID=UPI0007021740|nr:hypothetical protein [Aurantimonas sp. Leaf443]KQT83947.1 hypothetical protein ASG48_11210 [Aurantimonas sp. Leaf443]